MSRIGRKPIVIPAGVEVKIDGETVKVTGPKGTLTQKVHTGLGLEVEGNELKVSRPSDDRQFRSLHGLTRTLINNMVTGVTEGFKKELEISGVGYRAQKNGNELVLNVGYSNPVKILDTDMITTEVPNPQRIVVNGIDKQAVGQFAAEIRGVRPPEPYKGKGIHYVGEYIIRKEGKAGKA
ncbi:MAG: 50S ribosomal protein L6 [Oscillospiraceae bacterium]|jgi:large subunit ribosomal protein L6|nr:50S ribosomal protein L6 [Oscillospiraceae bacterium]